MERALNWKVLNQGKYCVMNVLVLLNKFFCSSEDEVGVASDSEESDDEESMSSDKDKGQRSMSEHKPTLRLSGGFRWDVGVVSDTVGIAQDSSDSEIEVEEVCSVFSGHHVC